ncbi:alpha/beta hydrolase-fold protein [Rheinheimera sp. F8]|uniref:alpha/beta hydrolase n=1 Tax=Rheinheimera sp. F8 TaxID=1763998 RepID=UPI000744986C|nr:alpha/beta hydrolase-fold protein [Rheinheimera sp. F8]ALZ75281.1 esterase [Rheinheimera sp. F8]ALZ76293.1 esterase [Rheinheimera sp. F8]
MKNRTVKLMLAVMCFVHLHVFAAMPLGQTEQFTLKSQLLLQPRELIVYLPADYAQSKQQYPVLYITDGDIQGAHTAGTVDYLSKFDLIPAMIVVGIVTPRQQRVEELTLAQNSAAQSDKLAGADLMLAHLAQEIIPAIKSRYRTSDYQALAGTSHGGQFAVNAAIKRPGLFNGVIAISPSLYWNNNQMIDLAAAALKTQRISGRVFLSIANEEPVMTNAFQQLVDLTNQYPGPKLQVKTQTFSDESHDSTTLVGQYQGLKHLFTNWAIPNVPQNLADLQAVFNARSQLLGQKLQIPEDKANGYAQWLQYLNRQDEVLELLVWNRKNYPQSFNTHISVIQAYLHFKLTDKAKAAYKETLQSLTGITAAQQAELDALFNVKAG